MPGRMLRTHATARRLALVAAGCALTAACSTFDPAPPPPIRPTDKDVVLAWTIEEGLYDKGLARETEVVQFRYLGSHEDGMTEVQDYGRRYRGDERPRDPTLYRHRLTTAQLDELQHRLAALELPDSNRRQEKPGIVPWTMWGICVPVTRGMQCGQLLVDEWREILGAPALFALLESYRHDARIHPEK